MKLLRLGSPIFLVGIAVLLLGLARPQVANLPSLPSAVPPKQTKLARTQPFFEQNIGQQPASVDFTGRWPDYDLSLGRSEIVFKPRTKSIPAEEVSLALPSDEHKLEIRGEGRLPAVINYYLGSDPRNWHSAIPTFGRVVYRNVFSGVDLLFYEKDGDAEFDFRVAPGADPREIRLKVSAPYRFSRGDLLLGFGQWIRIRKPRAYQIIGDRAREVAADYVIEDDELRIRTGEYDRSRSLVIDPSVLYQGHVPGTASAFVTQTLALVLVSSPAVASDSQGNAYVVGSASGNSTECAVTKFSSTGTMLYQSVYGPVGSGTCLAIAADGQGNAYITGYGSGFPVTQGVVAPTLGGALALKLTSTGKLSYSTHLGGSGSDIGDGIAVDSNGNAYVTGSTTSNDFPLVKAFQSSLNGSSDAFVSVLNPTASALVYSTYLGGGSADQATGIAVDSTGEAYVTGATNSTDFPLKNPLLSSCTSPCNFLTKFDSTGASLVYSTYVDLPAISYYGPGIALDQAGDAFVGSEAWIASVSPSGTLNFSEGIPANGSGACFVGVDAAGNAYLGCNVSLYVNYTPVNPIGLPVNISSVYANSFLASFTNSGTLIYSTPIADYVSGVAGAESGNVYLTGAVEDGTSYFTVNMSQPASGVFVSKISGQGGPALAYLPASLTFGYQQIGVTSQPLTWTLANLTSSGTLDLNSIVVSGPGFAPGTSTCGTTLAPSGLGGEACTYSVTFTPQDTGPATGAITITDNAPGSPHVIQLSGQGAVAQLGISPTSLSFPNTGMGQSSAAQSVTLTNTGHATLSISHIAISGDFSETNTCGTAVNAGQNCSIGVTFTPTALGNRTGALTLTDNASNSPQTISLSGAGVTAGLNLQAQSGSPTSVTVQAGLTANYALEIGAARFSGMAMLSCTGAPTGASCSLPTSVKVNGSTATPFKVSVATTSGMMGRLQPASRPSGWLWATVLPGIVFVPLAGCKKRFRVGKRLVPIALLMLLCSCGGGSNGSNPNGTPAGTYQLTVTATSGSISQSMALTLKVQ